MYNYELQLCLYVYKQYKLDFGTGVPGYSWTNHHEQQYTLLYIIASFIEAWMQKGFIFFFNSIVLRTFLLSPSLYFTVCHNYLHVLRIEAFKCLLVYL